MNTENTSHSIEAFYKIHNGFLTTLELEFKNSDSLTQDLEFELRLMISKKGAIL